MKNVHLNLLDDFETCSKSAKHKDFFSDNGEPIYANPMQLLGFGGDIKELAENLLELRAYIVKKYNPKHGVQIYLDDSIRDEQNLKFSFWVEEE